MGVKRAKQPRSQGLFPQLRVHPQRREKALGTRLRAKLTLSMKLFFKINVLHLFNKLNTFLFRKLCFLKTIHTNYSSLIIDLLPFESCLDYHFPVVLNFHALKWSNRADYNFQLHVNKIFFLPTLKEGCLFSKDFYLVHISSILNVILSLFFQERK